MLNISDETYLHIATSCTYGNISRTARMVTHLFDETLKPIGLSAGQFTLLVALAVAKEVTIKPLAQILQMDRTTLTRNLRPLQREGYVEVKSGADQRQRVVRLTPKGQATLDEGIPLWEKAQQVVINHLGEQRWQALMGQLGDTVSFLSDGMNHPS